MWNNLTIRRGVALVLLSALLLVAPAGAVESSSSNYRFDETSIGAGGLVESSSANFQGRSQAGDTGVGGSASSNFRAEAGSVTTNDPRLAVEILSTNADFGQFSAATAATAAISFSVLNYTAYGYVVQIEGTTPTNGTYSLPGLTSNSVSQAGIEQFGVNLVANTSPASVGANPDNGTTPNNFGLGQASPNYAISNQYRYVSGETIALAPKSSGLTTYTMSYLVNVAPLTPGGQYASNQTIIVTGTY